MKIGKPLFSFATLLLLGSCFHPPEYPHIPDIRFDRIEYHKGNNSPDLLILHLSFKDGDGDLGLSGEFAPHISNPYHPRNFYQGSNGTLTPVTTSEMILPGGNTISLLNISNPSSGKLVFPRTRKQSGYSTLPVYGKCEQSEASPDYEVVGEAANLYIEEADLAVLDDVVEIIDMVEFQSTRYMQIGDTLYFTPNPNHVNIEVDFLVRDPDSTHPEHPGFTEYDWRRNHCLSFDGRFPILSDSRGTLEGILSYSMISTGFTSIFDVNTTLKLRVRIKDRALNLSNVVYSNEFNLN